MRKFKNLVTSKRKGDASQAPSDQVLGSSGQPGIPASNRSTIPTQPAQLPSEESSQHEIQKVPIPLEKVEINKEEQTECGLENVDNNNEEIVAIDPPTYTSATTHPNPRVEAAKRQILEASKSLADTLELYRKGKHDEDLNIPFLTDDSKLTEPGEQLTPEQLVTAVDAVLNEQKTQKPSRSSRVGATIGKIYPLFSLTLGIGANIADGATFAPVKGAANVLSLLLSIANQEQGKSADFLKQLDRISYQALRVAEIQKLGDITIGDLVLEKSMNLLTAILLFFKEAIVFFRHGYFFNLGKTILLGPQIYADAKSLLDTAIVEYDQSLLLQVTIEIIRKGFTPPAIQDPSNANSTVEPASWLQSSHREVDAEYSRFCQDRADGTLKWVLEAEEFKTWRLSDKKNPKTRSLWLNGLPGVGKSVVAAYITQALQAQYPDAAVLYYFSKAGNPSLDNVKSLIRTLAAQLVLAVPAARSHIRLLKDDKFTSDSELHLLQKFVKDSLVGVLQDVFIVIDGFDECDNNPDSQRAGDNVMERCLEELLKMDVKLLVSSRPIPVVSRAMSDSTKREFTFEDSRDDIKSYVAMRVSQSKVLQKGFEALGEEPAEFLASKSKGNFLWVKIVLNILRDKSMTKDFQQVIHTIPKNLGDIYDELLNKLDESQDLQLALTLLRMVLFSMHPLTLNEVEVAANLLLGETIELREFVESCFGSFLQVARGKATGLYIGHETFRSYITTKTLSKDRCLLPGASHLKLAIACVGCVAEPENNKLDAFREYAVLNWPEHLADFLEESGDVPNSDILQLLQKIYQFCTSLDVMKKWMEQYSFQCNEKYLIGTRIANLHDIIIDFLKSDQVCRIQEQELLEPGDSDSQSAMVWRCSTIENSGFASNIAAGFANVWISTNWREVQVAQWVLEGAYQCRSILVSNPHLVEAGTASRFRKPREVIGEEASRRKGWCFSYPGVDSSHQITVEELSDLADYAGYQKNLGVHSGNYAIGLLIANSKDCIRNFQNAIDEEPEAWHLHEALGNYYERNDQRDNAIKSYAEAIKCDTKNPPSAAFDHWSLVSKAKQDSGDIEGAIEALKVGVSTVPDSDSIKYWNLMAGMYEKEGNGNVMINLYDEAIKKQPGVCNYFWKKLGEIYGRGGARQMEFNTYHGAMLTDKENVDEYGEKIRELADHMKDLYMWQPVIFMLGAGIKADKENARKYHKELGLTHMCQRNWQEAIDQFAIYLSMAQNDWMYVDIGHAYLGLGNTTEAIAAYSLPGSSPLGLARSVGYVHIIDGNYTQAIKLFKLALNHMASEPSKEYGVGFMQAVNDVKAQRLFELHRSLGLCYEATGRLDEMKECLQNAVDSFKETALAMDEDKDRNKIYRHEARALFELSLVQEKLGQRDEAKVMMGRATVLFEKTSLNTDNEVQQSEAEEAAAAIKRLSLPEEDSLPLPDLKEKIGEMRLQRRLALKYITDWYCFKHWEPPRYRGGKEWNEVSFTNKFKITSGDRTFIAPWGFGHGE